MAAVKPKSGSSKSRAKPSSKPSQGRSTGKVVKKKSGPAPKPVQQKTKSSTVPAKKKKRVYTAKELGIPELNGIRPTGVNKPPNMKKGKNFVDDKDGMNAILAMVMAEKEGNIESKMLKARHMEEIREARRAEAEKRAEGKKKGLDERKQEIKENSKRKRKSDPIAAQDSATDGKENLPKKTKKRVSFG